MSVIHLNSSVVSEYYVMEWEEVTIAPLYADEIFIVNIEEDIVLMPFDD